MANDPPQQWVPVYLISSVWGDGQAQARLADCAGPGLVNLLAELNSHSQLSLQILVVMESPAFS